MTKYIIFFSFKLCFMPLKCPINLLTTHAVLNHSEEPEREPGGKSCICRHFFQLWKHFPSNSQPLGIWGAQRTQWGIRGQRLTVFHVFPSSCKDRLGAAGSHGDPDSTLGSSFILAKVSGEWLEIPTTLPIFSTFYLPARITLGLRDFPFLVLLLDWASLIRINTTTQY